MNNSRLPFTALVLLLAGGLLPLRLLPAAAASTVQFQSPLFYAAGPGPVAVTVADFNHDGIQDLAVANRSANTVSVLLGLGGGKFGAPVSYAVGDGPVSLAAGDLTGDGNADLVVADNYDSTVSVLLGNGNGTFRPAVRYSVPLGPQSVALGDLTHTGHLDIVVATGVDGTTGAPGTVSVLRNRGDGTFLAPVSYRAGTNPFAMAVATGLPGRTSTLFVANDDAGNSISVLQSRERGFSAPATYAAGAGPFALALGDFNGDGNLDVVVADQAAGTVRILLGRRNGSFAPGGTFPAGPNPQSLASADFNHDGHLDLVTADPYDQVHVLLGNGDGTFQAPSTIAANHLPPGVRSSQQSLAVGDFNHDGWPDLAVTDLNNHDVSILLNSHP